LLFNRKGQFLIENSGLKVGMNLNHEEGIEFFLLRILLLFVKEDVAHTVELTLRNIRHRCAKLNILWLKVLPQRNVGTRNHAELTVSNNFIS
jgi:hypothetical protein